MTSWTERQDIEDEQHEETFQKGVAEGRRQAIEEAATILKQMYLPRAWSRISALADTSPEESPGDDR